MEPIYTKNLSNLTIGKSQNKNLTFSNNLDFYNEVKNIENNKSFINESKVTNLSQLPLNLSNHESEIKDIKNDCRAINEVIPYTKLNNSYINSEIKKQTKEKIAKNRSNSKIQAKLIFESNRPGTGLWCSSEVVETKEQKTTVETNEFCSGTCKEVIRIKDYVIENLKFKLSDHIKQNQEAIVLKNEIIFNNHLLNQEILNFNEVLKEKNNEILVHKEKIEALETSIENYKKVLESYKLEIEKYKQDKIKDSEIIFQKDKDIDILKAKITKDEYVKKDMMANFKSEQDMVRRSLENKFEISLNSKEREILQLKRGDGKLGSFPPLTKEAELKIEIENQKEKNFLLEKEKLIVKDVIKYKNKKLEDFKELCKKYEEMFNLMQQEINFSRATLINKKEEVKLIKYKLNEVENIEKKENSFKKINGEIFKNRSLSVLPIVKNIKN